MPIDVRPFPMLGYPDSVEFLYSLGNEIKTARFGLEAITALLGELGNPQDTFEIVHVAGTNGKGSTCAMLESSFRAAGLKTGLYTSPHLIEPTERIRIAGVQVSRDKFADAFRHVHEANLRLLARGCLHHHTTYFETVTAMGFLLMRDEGIDVAVVEVGLGGRLDATNVVKPKLTVITAIDFDHEAFLGNSLQSIAAEKAGILKPGIPAVFSRQRSEAEGVLDEAATRVGARVVKTSEYCVRDLQIDARSSSFTACRDREVHITCPLAGRWQIENALTAVAALERLGVDPHAIQRGIANTSWPGRLQRIFGKPDILLDGAHNPGGARALASHLREFYAGRFIRLIYGAMRDKSVQEITEILFPLASEVLVVGLQTPRAVRPEALMESAEHSSMHVVANAAKALELARTSGPEEIVVITGSLYLVGEILGLLQ